MRRERIVERHARCHRQQTDTDKRYKNTGKTYPCREHGNNFIRPRHSAERKKKGQQKRNRQQDNEYLRDLRGVIARDQKQWNMVVNETRDIVADVEDEPDRGESRDAVKINLHEVSNHVSIKKSHCDYKCSTVISLLKQAVCAKFLRETMAKSE